MVVAEMVADMAYDMEVHMVADMELDMVADMEVDKVWPTWRPTCSKA